jgi:branched-subunit amino acid transport protein
VNPWLVVLAAGLGSYLLRLSMIWNDRIHLPSRLDDAGALVGPSAFAALAVTGVATAVTAAGSALAPIAAVAVAVFAVHRTGRGYAASLAGMPTYWIVQAVVSSGSLDAYLP